MMAGIEQTPFWLVWCPIGAQPPRHRHPTRESAEVEAARLARTALGVEFFVVEPTLRLVTYRTEEQRFADLEREVPF